MSPVPWRICPFAQGSEDPRTHTHVQMQACTHTCWFLFFKITYKSPALSLCNFPTNNYNVHLFRVSCCSILRPACSFCLLCLVLLGQVCSLNRSADLSLSCGWDPNCRFISHTHTCRRLFIGWCHPPPALFLFADPCDWPDVDISPSKMTLEALKGTLNLRTVL